MLITKKYLKNIQRSVFPENRFEKCWHLYGKSLRYLIGYRTKEETLDENGYGGWRIVAGNFVFKSNKLINKWLDSHDNVVLIHERPAPSSWRSVDGYGQRIQDLHLVEEDAAHPVLWCVSYYAKRTREREYCVRRRSDDVLGFKRCPDRPRLNPPVASRWSSDMNRHSVSPGSCTRRWNSLQAIKMD